MRTKVLIILVGLVAERSDQWFPLKFETGTRDK